jgi:hypothetical protein
MQIFTTKAFSELPDADEMRSNGPGQDALFLENKSGTVQLEATLDEVESALEQLEMEIDSDVISDEVMVSLIELLNTARQLDVPVA